MNQYKIMLVDDEPDILDLLEKALNIEGFYNITKIDNGISAVTTCREMKPDVVVLDVMLPDIDGYEMCKQIREFSHCPVLFLFSKNDELDKILGLAVGGDDYVTKPFKNYPARYSASELISFSGSAYEQGHTVFVSTYEDSGETWSYLIGFPYAIGKHMIYSNGDHVGRLSFLFLMGISALLCFVLLFMVCYDFWLTRHFGRIVKGIGDIALRSYAPLIEKGVFGEIYGAMNSGAVPYHPQPVRLVRFLKELVIDIVNDPAFSNRRIGFESKIQECEVSLDIDLFRRAVNNLIINALTHNPPETEVTIRIDSGSEKKMLICISDNGTGMSDKEQSELFNRYYRGTNTKEKPEGSGLGLAIARQIITLHGGNIDVRSRLGEGTCFTIVLSLGNP